MRPVDRAGWGRRVLLVCVWLVALGVFATEAAAEPGDWSRADVKGQTFDTRAQRGKVLLVLINSPELKGQMLPLTERLLLKHGHDRRLSQVTLVDLREAPLTWRAAEQVAGTVTEKMVEVHDWNVQYIHDLLKKNKKPKIPGLSRKLHIVMDWDGGLVSRYKTWDTQKMITIVVIDPAGDVVGAWPGHQIDRAMEAVEALLEH